MRRGAYCLILLALLCGCRKLAPEAFGDYVAAVSLASTDNALRYKVAVESRRSCTPRVEFRAVGDAAWRSAPDGVLMFLYPHTEYEYRVVLDTPSLSGEIQTFTTGEIPPEVPVYDVTLDEGGPKEGYLLQWQATKPGYLTFCDMQGKVVWYEVFDQAVRHVHYDPSSGKIAVLTGFREGVNSPKFQRLCDRILLIDLCGNRIIDWTASEQNVPYPHHDIKIMPDGNLLIFNAVIKSFDLSPVGGKKDTPVWGDGFTILSPEGAVLRRWDVFGALDPIRDTWLDAVALDYDLLHGNSVAWDDAGDFYITLNRYSELWKIDGKTGDVVYRIGEHGDTALDGDYPVGGLHSAVPLASDKVLCYNNGGGDNPCSRAQIYETDPLSKKTTRTLDVPVDAAYSSADRSNVELLPDGKTLLFASTLARKCVFTDLEGRPLKVISRTGIAYRSHYFLHLFPQSQANPVQGNFHLDPDGGR